MISLTSAQRHDSVPQQNLLFLQAVASDVNFRRELESNPTSALAQFGLSVNEMPDQVTLPSQDELNASLEYLASDKVELHWYGYYQMPN